MNKIYMIIAPELGCRELGCSKEIRKAGFDEGMVNLEIVKVCTGWHF